MAKLIELNAIYDTENIAVQAMRPARILIDTAAIESILENPFVNGTEQWPKGCRITLTPAVAEWGDPNEIAQGQRTIGVTESYEQLAAALSDERGIIRVLPNLT